MSSSKYFDEAERSGSVTPEQPINLVTGLRMLADFLEAHPVLLENRGIKYGGYTIDLFTDSREDFANLAKEFGAAEKVSSGDWYIHRKQFGPVKLDLNAQHEDVCVRKVIRTRVIPAHIIPASPETEVPEQVIEDVAWECPGSILAEVSHD